MAIIDANSLKAILPETFAGKIVDKEKSTSTVARLSASEPMLFGHVNYVRFNDTVRAEFVEEKGEKSSTSASWDKVTAVPHKSVVTVRVTDEFLWTDEDHQVQIIDRDVVPAMRLALARALDLGLYHRVNPLTGNTIETWTNYLTSTTLTVEQNTTDADVEIRTAAGLVVANDADVDGWNNGRGSVTGVKMEV